MSSKLSDFGLSQGKFKILLVLYRFPSPLKPSELAAYAKVTRSTMTGLINGLEGDGFIRRGSHEDGRMTAIHLTEAGIDIINRLLPFYAAHNADLMSELTKEDHKSLQALLKKVRIGLNRIKE
ncbi:MarR family winged helix-turn-helix transcriptional regulator [Bacillus sp. V5-8f]|uniref:MarR family winged helix-turn-helix transcriptional regulator n=1 Tax=Bacillus sp. V5-8f TaxID=2053044 RepID=UPI0015E0CDA5|nr:MarR family transcriptional regulator [Bacillus sp. V5-8f]